ncbi:rifamycin-inactivating phosphotransferase [Actinomadura gamaensis]|uniref:Rifamycin-inactivating phosphotransferase n=1 Tax=Actinomadura gamaensis TaxID=1763541 RepID=A0ABV9TT01_9ACTN
MGYVLGFGQFGATNIADVGGKGARLAELSRLDGVRVPDGFCVTTDAFRQVVAEAPAVAARLGPLARAGAGDPEAIRALSADIREAVESVDLPAELVAAIGESLARIGEDVPCAVRSSATAEDLPDASFAGQQDSFLNVVGLEEILRHVRLCWASLFSERAVTYRRRNGFEDRKVRMGVVVQRMVAADAAGVLFTADPVTSNRKVAAVEAVRGLGEALVSGRAAGEVHAVRDDRIVTRPDVARPVLTDEQVVRLVRLGRRIEAHFGQPQDIEWCLADDEFQIVQSRPITTLFPIPSVDDGENHVYLSVGHQQMMTDAIRPLGLSLWQLTTPRPMAEAGGRLFVDVTAILAKPAGREGFLTTMERSDPLMRDALQTVLDRDGFLRTLPDEPPTSAPTPAPKPAPASASASAGAAPVQEEPDPAIVEQLIRENRESVDALRREIREPTGTALLDLIMADVEELRRLLFDRRGHRTFMAAMEATWWLNDRLAEWLGETNAADALAQSVPHNVTSEMGLALLDVADAVRPHADVVAFLRRVADEDRAGDDAGDGFLDEMARLPGGPEARDALRAYLDAYGMRCAGEIDVTRTRWSERPAMLVPAILGHIANFAPGESRRRFERGLQESRQKEREVLERLRALPDGERKAAETKRMIDRVRAYSGYREYPKYGMVSRYFLYKQALLREAGRLVGEGVLQAKDDIFYLRMEELRDVVRTGEADADLIRERREAFRSYEALTPPRVLTSDGEALTGRYRRDDVPPGALVGLPVSAGTVEGRARVVTDMARADLAPGDILVTTSTDPSWTPLFVTAAGLVTEVGGLMTHGAVIAREYGLPAVVGVDGATRLIRDGQRIRVDGTAGHVELLP